MVKLTPNGVKINANLVWTSHNTGSVEFNTGVFAVYPSLWVILAEIIIIHRLRSRRPQGFSMHDDHQQMRQSAVLALLLHYPQAIFVHN